MARTKRKAASSPKKEASSAKRKTAFWLTITVVASVWMFVLGILVGRGTAPVQFDVKAMEQELADLKAALAAKESATEPKTGTPLTDKTQIAHFSFYDVLKDAREEKLPDDFDPLPENPATSGPVAPAPKEKSQAPKPTAAAAAKKTPAKQAPKTQVKRSPPKPATAQLTIQVMAVKDAKTADAAVRRLKSKGFDAYRSIVKVQGGGIRYRVRVGRYKSRKEANAVLAMLARSDVKGMIVSR
jgi:cell division septation protein DedD